MVDDEPDQRFLLRRIFQRAGHEVSEANDGAAALRAVRESAPDLVVTDVMMPIMDGVELIRCLRGDPATAHIPILAASGDTHRAGAADAVLAKPYDLQPPPRGRDCLAERRTWSELKRTTTGLAGLDLVLNGGLEPGAVVVVAGAPGTGKTILAQQMCFANGTADLKCVYYSTVSEPHTKLVRHLEQFTFFDPQALGTRVEYIHLGDFLRPARQRRDGAPGVGDRQENAGRGACHRGDRQREDAARIRR